MMKHTGIRRIESASNPAYKRLLACTHPKRAQKEGVFIVEGVRSVGEIPESFHIESIWILENYAGPLQDAGEIYSLPASLFQRVSETVHSQGILAVVRRRTAGLSDLDTDRGHPVLLLEHVQDPGNVGTMIRTADAVGACGLILTGGCCDLYNSKVIRASMGSLFHLPVVEESDIEQAALFLHEHGYELVGTHLHAEVSYTQADLSGKKAILIGNEGAGLSEKAVSLCDQLVKIPMPGQAESLNASIACAVLMYEGFRQAEQKRRTEDPKPHESQKR